MLSVSKHISTNNYNNTILEIKRGWETRKLHLNTYQILSILYWRSSRRQRGPDLHGTAIDSGYLSLNPHSMSPLWKLTGTLQSLSVYYWKTYLFLSLIVGEPNKIKKTLRCIYIYLLTISYLLNGNKNICILVYQGLHKSCPPVIHIPSVPPDQAVAELMPPMEMLQYRLSAFEYSI